MEVPPSDRQTLWECSELGSMVTKMFASLATCLTSVLKVMLFLVASSALEASTSKAKTWCPFLVRLSAMGNPIFPSPMNPILEKEKRDLATSCILILSPSIDISITNKSAFPFFKLNNTHWEDSAYLVIMRWTGLYKLHIQQVSHHSLVFYLAALHCWQKGRDYKSQCPESAQLVD